MRVVIDIEADALVDPTQIWLIVCKDIDTGEIHAFRNTTSDEAEKARFLAMAMGTSLWIGHNLLGYDCIHIRRLLGLDISVDNCLDTLILSKLIDYPRIGHSIEDYGLEFNIPKGKFIDFSKYSIAMEEYCIRDVDICHKIYLKYFKYLSKEESKASIDLEHRFQLIVNSLTTNGFSFNKTKAEALLVKVVNDLSILDKDIHAHFPPKLKLIREVHPKVTKHGTLSKTDFRFVKNGDLSDYNGGPFSHCQWEIFNPSSHKQIISVLNETGWSPTDKTQTHIDTERELQRLKYSRKEETPVDLTTKSGILQKLDQLKLTGWKINENNLATLPDTAPPSARTLAKRILLESRRRTLTEWLGLVSDNGRIHGKFYGIGAWTHRMAHQNPNTANIPNEFDTQGKKKLLGKEMRALWQAPKNRLLVGVDAEGIQLRIFAHYIDDAEFTKSLVDGKKEDKSDPHSLNQRILGDVCKSRAAAKRFIYALLLGAGVGKLEQILEASKASTQSALERLMERYTGFALLKETHIPADAKRGWFVGLDGRSVKIPAETVSGRRHLCMSGYLQCGEAVVMKKATLKWHDLLKQDNAILVNFVHDEWQTEVPNNMEIALKIAKLQADSLREVGEELNLKCPLAGSYWNDDLKDYTIHTNWSKTH